MRVAADRPRWRQFGTRLVECIEDRNGPVPIGGAATHDDRGIVAAKTIRTIPLVFDVIGFPSAWTDPSPWCASDADRPADQRTATSV